LCLFVKIETEHASCLALNPKAYIHGFWEKYDDRIPLLRLCRYFYTQFCFIFCGL